MTHREFLQFFGTDICRKIYEDIWRAKLIEDISRENPLLAVIDDCRFPEEIETIQSSGGKVIHLTRTTSQDRHASEAALDGFDGFDCVIDNQDLSIHETNIKIIIIEVYFGIFYFIFYSFYKILRNAFFNNLRI